ncbi:hypothetical protein DMC64_20295 [Amycolatopsis sp. WAC 04197]|uniref:hypothetical protein n=1 Tax=Amycolatopsis sp. WAC 04197 TaxID=2203199 RepID=UPI000F78FC01|nr:hypothetical protein [Amycolatopsis sp. WAC 04197]RSN45181.1 hypothetical protein DMC64_20295 [Amycolatopsis sp. WAC 04197]
MPGALLVGTLGCLAGSAIGFALILTPLVFAGSSQFSRHSLDDGLMWCKVVCAFNPLACVSDGMRVLLVTDVPHMPLALDLLALVVAILGFGYLGTRSFLQRALD